MYYTVYKITNRINGKYYIGKHKTTNLDDKYMGSGKILLQAYIKYGRDNFTKEILFIFDNEEDMNNKEKELVVVSEETYNIKNGGQGGFDYINVNGIIKFNGKKHTEETKEKIRIKALGNKNMLGRIPWNKGKRNIYSEDHKARISESLKQTWLNKKRV